MTYQTNLATSDLQQSGNDTVAQLLSAFQAYASNFNESGELSALQQIVTALASQATAAGQASALTALSSILSAMATAAKQDTGNTSLASIDSKLSASTATLSQANQSTTSAIILPANASRKGLYLYNNTGMKCYVAFAATASSSAFTLFLAANSGYESPQLAVYKGQLSAVWSGSGGGNLQVTEIT